ncbi:hypothetical protein ACJJTC_012365 [Scirpophaga incertulas]
MEWLSRWFNSFKERTTSVMVHSFFVWYQLNRIRLTIFKRNTTVGAQAPSFVGGCRRSSEEAALAQVRAEDMETGRPAGTHSAIELPGHRSYRADTKFITCTKK